MSIQLEAIKFNHDSGSAAHDALNIRKNAGDFLTVPEWRRGISVNPEDSRAAYSRKDAGGNQITIQARFSCADPNVATAQIRALDANANPPKAPGCLGVILHIIWAFVRALVGNVLGEVKARSVSFSGGVTGYETFELKNVTIAGSGVGIRTTRWRWQYRLQGSGAWTDMITSSHRIYVLLETPKAPWQQAPYNSANIQLPWTDVMDYACSWAATKLAPEEAACAITKSIFDLGPATITYDCPGGGGSHYSWPDFDCTAFLDRLHGGTGNGIYVNCSDCATFVSAFANIVGCDLWQSRMGYGFGLNPLLAIGSSTWQSACGWSGFSYHEVAWTEDCGADDTVYDACLKVDGDADPTSPPHTPAWVCGMRFGNCGDGDYRDRLATPSGCPSCAPQPTTRQRRVVS